MAYFSKTRVFDPGSREPFKVSRSKIDMFMDCPRCFYLEARHGVKRPSMPAFTLNVAVDALLKKEFDTHRVKGVAHPLMKAYGLDAVPFKHPMLDQWRENFVGVQSLHQPTNLLVFGAVDDLWVSGSGEVHVVDYKATSKASAVTSLDDTKWHNQYRRQMEIYQWLLKENGLTVSDVGYFVYVNGKKDLAAFDAKLEFDVNLIEYKGGSAWVPEQLQKLKVCLLGDLPSPGSECEHCQYRQKASQVEAGSESLKEIKPVTPKAKKQSKVQGGVALF